jgi:Ca2+-binding EF-hand superfamily protein
VDQDGNVYANGSPQVKFEEKAGKVDGTAFRAAFRAAGLAPVQAAVKPARSQTAAMTDALFKLLDADKDDRLSGDELKAARDKLARLDVNEDEIVTSQETLDRGYSNPYGQYVISQVFDGNQPGKAAPPSDFVFPAADPAAAAKELIRARDKNKDGTLTREELGCDAKGLTGLDADTDGRVGAAELTAWLRSPPDLEFRLEFGDAAGKRTWVGEALGALSETFRGNKPERPPGLALVPSKSSRFAGMAKPAGDGAVALGLTDARVRFSANRDMKQNLVSNWEAQVQQFKTQFDQQAGDKKVLTRQQLQQDGNLAQMVGLFDFGDRNADGKLDKKEVEAGLAALAPLIACRADVSITDQGRGLFELIDRDADGRLSPRELATAPGIIGALDRDGDGRLAKTEVPKVIAAAAAPASAQVVQTSGFFFGDFAFATPQGAVSEKSANAPTWFNKMDRNGDGDVSRREFLGPAEAFQKLDADGDGLVSPEEARAKRK